MNKSILTLLIGFGIILFVSFQNVNAQNQQKIDSLLNSAMKKTSILTVLFFCLLQINAQNNYPLETVIQLGHSSSISDICFSPDNKFAATASWDNTAKLWHIATGAEMRTFNGHTDWLHSVDFSPSGKHIVTGASDGTFRIWDIKTGKQTDKFYVSDDKENLNWVKYVKYLDDDNHVLAASELEICVFDIKNKKKAQTFNTKISFESASVSSDFKYLIIGGTYDRKEVCEIWNIKSGKKISTFINEKDHHSPSSVAVSPDGKYAVFDGLTKIFWYNTKTNEVIKEIDEYKHEYSDKTDKSSDVTFSKDGKKLYIQRGGPYMEIYNCETQKLARKIKAGAFPVISPDGKYILCKESPVSRWAKKTDERLVLINAETEKRIKQFGNAIYPLNSANLAKDKNLLVTSSSYTSVKLWDIANATILNAFDKTADYADIDDKGEYIVHNGERYANIISIKKAEYIQTIKSQAYMLHSVRISNKGRYFSMLSSENRPSIYSLPDTEPIGMIDVHSENMTFSNDGTYIFVSESRSLKKYKMDDLLSSNLSISDSVLIDSFYFKNFAVSSNNRYYAVEDEKEEPFIHIFDRETKKVTILKGHKSDIKDLEFSPDNKQLATVSGGYIDVDNTVRLWNIPENKQEVVLRGHKREITSVTYTADGKKLITCSRDGTVIIRDLKTYKPIVTLCAIGDGTDFVAITPDNYYYCSEQARKSVFFVKGLDVFSFENFDIKYNRPDIILKRIGYADEKLIKSFEKAYKKRLKKTGFNEKMFNDDWHIPKVEIVNAGKIEHETKKQSLKLQLKAEDSKYLLDRIIILVNGVPMYGMKGFDISNQKISEITKKLRITLSEGENKIQISVINSKGAESIKQTVYVNYKPEQKSKHKLYIAAIGVSEYDNSAINLSYASKDAEDVMKLFKDNSNKYSEVILLPVINKDATQEKILKLKDELMNSKVDDQVIVFYAGHGILDNDYNYFLAVKDIDIDDISGTALAYEDFESLIDGIPARKKLILIDACHSGEVDNDAEVSEGAETFSNNRNVVKFSNKTRDVLSGKTSNLSLKSSFQLMKVLFADLRKGTGASIISSAGGGEFAIEGEMMKNGKIIKISNGIFTFSLLEALQNNKADIDKSGNITISELRDYVFKRVSKLSAGYQNPTSRRENPEFDFVVW